MRVHHLNNVNKALQILEHNNVSVHALIHLCCEGADRLVGEKRRWGRKQQLFIYWELSRSLSRRLFLQPLILL
jgi:hypothetical protein